MGRPIIGITSELDAARWGDWIREAAISPVSYTRVVERAGGAPVIVPPVPPASVAAYIETFDGLVFSGGRDMDSTLYDQQPLETSDEPDRRRDRFELALMRAALEANVPFLAIGRGLHILAVARGGTLTQDLPGHRAGPPLRPARPSEVNGTRKHEITHPFGIIQGGTGDGGTPARPGTGDYSGRL
jgi:gamma-glutamyl-gamma-aminobutyrate hydrolase PuuD